MAVELAYDRLVEANVRIDIWDLLRAGLLAEGATARLEIGEDRGYWLARRTPDIWIDETRIAVVWDSPMPGVNRPWWCCPICGQRCRHVYLCDAVGCWRCLGLRHFCRSRRQLPGTATVVRLRRKLSASADDDVRQFAPLPPRRRGHSREYYWRVVGMIRAEEERLLARWRGA